jgi:hypothetical protein
VTALFGSKVQLVVQLIDIAWPKRQYFSHSKLSAVRFNEPVQCLIEPAGAP